MRPHSGAFIPRVPMHKHPAELLPVQPWSGRQQVDGALDNGTPSRRGSVVLLPLLKHLGDIRQQLPTRLRILVDASDALKPRLRIEAVLL